MRRVFVPAAALALAATSPRFSLAQTAPQGSGQPQEIPITCQSSAAVAEVTRARTLIDNVRLGEASAALEKAVQLDPACPTAHALLATVSTPSEARKHVELALAGAAGLPEAERTQIEVIAAGFRGENAKARELQAKLVELAPANWRAHNQLGGLALGDQDYQKAIAEFRKAIELNPDAASAYNNLGYSYAGQQKFDEAAEWFRKYAAVAPQEPNAHDSLAEVLMNAGRLAESEAEFQKALSIEPRFAGAWTGIAETRFLRGDLAGGDDALAREKGTDTRPQALLGVEVSVALARLLQGKAAECWKQLDQVESKAAKLSLPQRYLVPTVRARLLTREGKAQQAAKVAGAALEAAAKADVPDGPRANFRRLALVEVVRSQAQAGNEAAAREALASLEEAIAPVAQVAFFASALENARGLAALAAGDANGAATALQKCVPADFNCQYDRVRALEKAGDKAGAAAAREAFFKTRLRGLEYVYLWKKLGGKPGSTMAGAPGAR